MFHVKHELVARSLSERSESKRVERAVGESKRPRTKTLQLASLAQCVSTTGSALRSTTEKHECFT